MMNLNAKLSIQNQGELVQCLSKICDMLSSRLQLRPLAHDTTLPVQFDDDDDDTQSMESGGNA